MSTVFHTTTLFREMSEKQYIDHKQVLKYSDSPQAKSEAQMVEDILTGKIKHTVNKHNNLVFETGSNTIVINWIDFNECTCAVTIDDILYDGNVERYQIGERVYVALICGGELVLVFNSKEG